MPLDGQFSLAGRTALVTGGGSGIGRAIAEALSEAGARLVLVGRRQDRLLQALGERAGHTIALDLNEAGAHKVLAEQCTALDCAPDIVVNAAGINPRLPADTIDEASWQATIHLNLTVPFLVARAFVPAMRSKRWGRIINIASLQSYRAFENGIAYGASKGGITQLTRAMAEAWSRDGINANALAPGFFKTELTQAVFANAQTAAMHAERTAIGRNGNLSDLAGPAVFLASDASVYITGQVLAVDGGYTAR